MTDDTVIRVENVWKQYGTPLGRLAGRLLGRGRPAHWSLSDVSFSLRRGEAVGIIGRNGAGKSTLLKVLAGVTPPTRGRVEVSGRMFPMIELNAGIHPDLSGAENIFVLGAIMGLSRREIRRKLPEIVGFSELEPYLDRPVRTYSSGMMARLGFSVAVHVDADVLLIDEVLSVGDVAFQRKCLSAIERARHAGAAVVFVSHSPYQVERTCDDAIMLDGGRIVRHGPPSQVLQGYFSTFVRTGAGQAVVLPDPAGRAGTGDLRITAIEFLDAAGRDAGQLGTDSRATLRLHYETAGEIGMPNVSLRVMDPYNTIVASMDYTRFRVPGRLRGRGHFDCAIDRMPLLANDYTLSVRVKGLALLDEIVGVPFAVTSPETVLIDTAMLGTAYCAAEWSHRPEQAAEPAIEPAAEPLVRRGA